jgi:hypothetical protein
MRAGRRWRFVSAVVIASCLSGACGSPPDKEIEEAAEAIDAAKAASAETYSKTEFTASTEALKNAHAAVNERDYRQALNYALDAKDRAQTAAREATERKATAKLDADRALRNAALALVDVRARLKSPQIARRPPRAVAAARKAAADAEGPVQEARAAFERGEYPRVLELLAGPSARLRESIRGLGESDAAVPKRGR